jgi:ribosome-binding factor A
VSRAGRADRADRADKGGKAGKAGLKVERLQELIRRDVAEMLTTGLRDPRLRLASVTGVKLSPDLRHASVQVSCLGSDADKRTFMRGLDSARGRIQSVIAKHLRTRVTPRLAFHYDDGIERSVRMSKLIEQARAEDRAAQRARGEDPEAAGVGSPEADAQAPATVGAGSAAPAPDLVADLAPAGRAVDADESDDDFDDERAEGDDDFGDDLDGDEDLDDEAE